MINIKTLIVKSQYLLCPTEMQKVKETIVKHWKEDGAVVLPKGCTYEIADIDNIEIRNQE